MPINISSSVKVVGTIINSKQGIVELEQEIEGAKQFKSMNLAKYPDGTRVELTFRITGKGGRQLISHSEIKASDRFRLVLVDFAEDLNPYDLVDWLQGTMKFDDENRDRILDDINNNAYPVDIKTGLIWRDAYAFKDNLTKRSSNKATFDVIKHTSEDMPADIEMEFDVSSIEYVNQFYIVEELRPLFMAAANAVNSGGHLNVLFLGPSGYGKTSAAKALAEYLGYGFLRMDCSLVLDTTEWYGRHRAVDGSTFFVPTEFTEAVRRGKMVILLDEANRIEPWLSNSLFPLLDHARETWVQGEHIQAAPSIVFAFTMNVGIKYAGTHVVDAAWLNRMDAVVEVGPLPRAKEEEMLIRNYPEFDESEIRKIVGTVDELRRVCNNQQIDVDVSTRTSHKLVRMVSLGLSLRQAAKYVIENPCPIDDRKPIVDILNSRLGV